MAKIKICGLTRQQDIETVNRALPDYIGFVFANSKRRIGGDEAKALKAGLNPFIKTVGVFVNDDVRNIVRLCESGVIDMIQLHGDEDEDYIMRLKNSVPNSIIKAARVKGSDDIKKAMDFSSDFLLLDGYHEGMYGGSGKAFDWSVIPLINKPYFLAGGINSDNIMRALEGCKPYGIDVSSGAETNGFKDPEKIFDIVAAARRV